MANTGNIEIELKIRLDSFTDYLKLLGHIGPIDHTEHHHNAFFDSPERELSKAGYVLRVRSSDQSGSVTLKSAIPQTTILAVREEISGEVGSDAARRLIEGQADLMTLDVEPMIRVRHEFPSLKPRVTLKFRNERQVKRYRLGKHELNLEIDRTEFADGSTDYELEVELDDHSQFESVNAALERLFHCLVIPYEGQTKSKFERALARS